MAKRHRVKANTWSVFPLVAPVAMLAVLAAPHARAEWRINPSVDLRQTYSDNPGLRAPELAQGQFITELTPSLSIANSGPRLKLTGSISEALYKYSGNRVDGTADSRLQLSGDLRAKLVPELLFVDAAASVGQQAISAFGPQASSASGYSDTNRTTVRTYRVSPYLLHSFGTAMLGELRYSRDSVRSDFSGLSNSYGNAVSASLNSGPSFRTIGWGLQYMNRQDVEEALATKTRVQNISSNLRYRISHAFSLTANAGYDKYEYQSPGQPTAGKNYSAGFIWTPSSRTSIQASAGRRFFGKTYSLQSSHRSRSTVWSVNYNDAITNSREQFTLPAAISTASMLDRMFMASIPDPVARQLAIEAYIRATGLPPSLTNNINYLSNRFFVQRQFAASAAFSMPRTTAIVSLNSTRRSAVSSQLTESDLLGSSLLNQNNNNKQKGASVSVNYRLSPRSAVVLTANRTRTESLTAGQQDDNTLLSIGLTRQFQQKLRGALDLRRSQGEGTYQGARAYRENAITASLSYQL